MPPDTLREAQPTRTRPLRILVVGRGVLPIEVGCGGAELAMHQLSKAFALAGHDVTVVADVAGEDFPAVPGLRFVGPKRRWGGWVSHLGAGFLGWVLLHLVGNVSSAGRARELLREAEYDVIHCHGNLAALLIARFASVPVIYTEHDSTPWSCRYRRFHERLVRRAAYRLVNVAAFRRVARVAAICDALRLELIDRWHIPTAKVVAILNGTDLDVFNPDTSGGSIGSPFERYCLFVGRLTPRKAPDLLLHALVEAPEARCVIAGDGPMRPRLEELACELGVSERVAFLGNVSPADLAPLYRGADLLVVPSVSEGTPLVAFEAMACGTPVLSSRVAGLPELVYDWSTGFLVKPGDVGQLALAIRFLTADPDALARMGEEAQRRIRKRFLWPNVARQYLALFWSLQPDAPAAPAVEPQPIRVVAA